MKPKTSDSSINTGFADEIESFPSTGFGIVFVPGSAFSAWDALLECYSLVSDRVITMFYSSMYLEQLQTHYLRWGQVTHNHFVENVL